MAVSTFIFRPPPPGQATTPRIIHLWRCSLSTQENDHIGGVSIALPAEPACRLSSGVRRELDGLRKRMVAIRCPAGDRQ